MPERGCEEIDGTFKHSERKACHIYLVVGCEEDLMVPEISAKFVINIPKMTE